MKSRDDLISVLNLGWETARRAWRLLAPGAEFSVEPFGASGRDMDQVAYDLRRLGHGKPARMAFSVAFVLNGLAGGTIEFDRDLAEKTSQIVSILAEMLLELEATSQITAQEPAEIVELLQTRWGLVIWTEDHAQTTMPRPHFRVEVPSRQVVDGVFAGVVAMSQALVTASESLLHRTENDRDFPYASSLSHIHHLGLSIRDQITGQMTVDPSEASMASVMSISSGSSRIETAMMDALPIDVVSNVGVSLVDANSAGAAVVLSRRRQRQGDRPPLVLIVDESPFFRMLLTSAIESAGYEPKVFGSILDTRRAEDAQEWDLVICSAGEAVGDDNLNWLQSRDTEVILLESTSAEIVRHEFGQMHHIRRTDIAGLMALVKSMLGPVNQDIRLSA